MKKSGRPLSPLPPLLSGVRPLAGGQRRSGRSVHCKQKEQRVNGDTNDDEDDDDDDDDDEEDEERGRRERRGEEERGKGRM